MKKVITIIIFVVFIFLNQVSGAQTEELVGEVVKVQNSSTLYYIGDNNRRYVFPNEATYFTWYEDFSQVITVSQEALEKFVIGTNVRYKPGLRLVKSPAESKVYAVSQYGEIRWIKSEEIAKEIYGEYWSLLVDDIPDAFFTNYFAYQRDIEEAKDYLPIAEHELARQIDKNRHGAGYFFKDEDTIKYPGVYYSSIEKNCNQLKMITNEVDKQAKRRGRAIEDLHAQYRIECSEL